MKWVSEFLAELGLRDETPKAHITGLYCLKKTFITETNRLGLRYQPTTGHAEMGTSKALRDSYRYSNKYNLISFEVNER